MSSAIFGVECRFTAVTPCDVKCMNESVLADVSTLISVYYELYLRDSVYTNIRDRCGHNYALIVQVERHSFCFTELLVTACK